MIDPFHFKEPKQKKSKLVISSPTLNEIDQNSTKMSKVEEETLVFSKFKYSSNKYYPQSQYVPSEKIMLKLMAIAYIKSLNDFS